MVTTHAVLFKIIFNINVTGCFSIFKVILCVTCEIVFLKQRLGQRSLLALVSVVVLIQ